MSIAAWETAGGDVRRLTLYRSLGEVEPLVDASGRALVFGNGAIGDLTGGPTLIARAEAWLRARGVSEAVGPLDGNTFFAYRACVGPWDEPSFLGEPTASPAPWRALGYREEARYTSTLCPNGPQIENGRPLPPGWRVRPIDFGRLEAELASLYRVTLPAFASAWRYSPLPFPAFAALYAPFRDRVDPRWVLLAEDPAGVVQGYLFAWPMGDRFVIKTIAVHPEARGVRLGAHLMMCVHRFAEEQGIPRGVHALMWEGSVSRAITRHGGRVFRRYALYRKRL